MTAAAILSECQRRGVHLRVDGELIKYKPIAAVDGKLLEAMRAHKAELLAYLRRDEFDHVGPWQPQGATTCHCPNCGGGLQPGKPDGELCGSCVWYFERIAPTRPQ